MPSAFSITHYDLGASRWQRTGEVLPDSVLAELAEADVILLGAVGAAPGATDVPSGLLERGLLLKLRFAFDHYVNLRPSRLFPGVPTPLADSVVAGKNIDFVVVREGTEGLYCGNGGVVRAGTPHEMATEVSVNTAYGVERVVRDAFERATQAPEQDHAGAQAQRAGQRRRPVASAVRERGAGVSRGGDRLPARGRGHHLPGHRSGTVRRDRHRQPVRRHPDRPGRGGDRRHRPGGQRQHQPRRHLPLHVRAGARLGPRHRRARASPTRRRRSCRSACCWTISAGARRRRGSRRRSSPTSRPARPDRPRTTSQVGDAIAAAV